MADGENGHLSRDLLERFVGQSLAAPEAAKLFAHLLEGCQQCGEQLVEIIQPPPGRYDFALRRARSRSTERIEALNLARREVHLRFLGALQGEMQAGSKRNSLHEWVWCELLIALSELQRSKDLHRALDLAALAALTADRLAGPYSAQQTADLRARAWAELGNLQRISNELAAAEESLEIALGHISLGTGDDLLFARVLDLHGSLYRDQRRFHEAIRALDRASYLYAVNGEQHNSGRVLVNKGVTLIQAEQAGQALATLEIGLARIDPERDHNLTLAAIHNSLSALVNNAQHERASRLLWRCRPLYQAHATPLDRVRLLGLEAKVAAGLGQPVRAERLFREEKAGFEEAGLAYDSALVGLDLAALLVEQGRPAEVIPLVDEMLGSFHERGILREAFASLLLLRKAIEQGEATVALVRTLAEELKTLDHAARDR